jgi:integrase
MSVYEVSPNRFVVQISRTDPLRETNLRLCRRVAGRAAALEQQRTFEAQALEWVERRKLIKQAQAKGISIASPSVPSSAMTFASYLEETYLPWARKHLDPTTMESRTGTILLLADDLGNTPLGGVEDRVDGLVERWRVEGCRYLVRIDRRGRTLNRKPRPISDAGINERLKILRAVVGHGHMRARVLSNRPRIPLLRSKRALPGAAEPVRYFAVEERVRFLKYANPEMADVFQVGVLTGMRPAELFHVLVGSVDLKRKKILVQAGICPHCPEGKWIPKTGEYRAIDICDALVPILRRLLKGRRDADFLINNSHGMPFSRLRGGNGRFQRTLHRAGLNRKGLSFYSLRHTFAADLITAGRPISEVAALLGNAPRTCELHYAHLMPGKTREAVRVLRAIEPWPTTTVNATTTAAPHLKDEAA